MRSFIRAAEIWLPNGPDELTFGSGHYGGLSEFEALSRATRFRRGEGLPGKAWEVRRPVLLTSFANSYFQRTEAASAAGLSSGVAMPIFAADQLKAVVVFLCGHDGDHVGGIEIWRNDPETETQIGLVDGYYGGAELFELTSKSLKFGRGFGLPGTVWSSGRPTVMRDLYNSNRFLRREEALKVGLNMGLGLPFDYDPGRTWVAIFLSALASPIADRFEIWVPDATGSRLVYDAGLSDDGAESGSVTRPAAIRPDEGLIGRTFATKTPGITEDCRTDAAWLSPEHGASSPAVAIPFLDASGSLTAVTAWQF